MNPEKERQENRECDASHAASHDQGCTVMLQKEERMRAIEAWLEEHKQEFVEDLARFVAWPSVSVEQKTSAAPCAGEDAKYPYGKACADNIDFFLEKAASFGLIPENLDYYAGRARLTGSEGAKVIGIFGHGDVVPAVGEWEKDPFCLWQKGDWLVGRGSGDNKGPSLGALYALRYLKEQGGLKNHVDIYLGSAEETGMSDIRHLTEAGVTFPDFSLIPDAGFPVCYGEKGILRVKAAGDAGGSNLLEFTGGQADNIVASAAEALLEGVDYEKIRELVSEEERLTAVQEGSRVRVLSEGIGKHSAFPEGSIDAIGQLARFLSRRELVTGAAKGLVDLIGESTKDYYGQGLGIACSDEESGRLTHVLSIIRMQAGRLEITYNIRYPVLANGRVLESVIRGKLKAAGFADVQIEDDAASLREKGKEVELLTEISNELLGRRDLPYTMAGGTYARRIPNAVAYGFGSPGDEPVPFPEGQGGGHQPNEAVSLKGLLKGIEIYILALQGLDQIL